MDVDVYGVNAYLILQELGDILDVSASFLSFRLVALPFKCFCLFLLPRPLCAAYRTRELPDIGPEVTPICALGKLRSFFFNSSGKSPLFPTGLHAFYLPVVLSATVMPPCQLPLAHLLTKLIRQERHGDIHAPLTVGGFLAVLQGVQILAHHPCIRNPVWRFLILYSSQTTARRTLQGLT